MAARPLRTLRAPRAVVAALTLALASVVVAPTPAADASPAAESAFVARINGLRASRGLPTLSVSGELVGKARAWAAHMADAGGISHNPSLASGVSANWSKLGENVGVGATVDALHNAFVASPSHLANLVDPSYSFVGVGVVERNGQLYTSHVFMAVFGGGAPPPPAPGPGPSPGPGAGAPSGSSGSGSGSGGSGGGSGRSSSGGSGGTAAPPPTAPPAPPPPPPPPPTPDPLAALPDVLSELRALDARA